MGIVACLRGRISRIATVSYGDGPFQGSHVVAYWVVSEGEVVCKYSFKAPALDRMQVIPCSELWEVVEGVVWYRMALGREPEMVCPWSVMIRRGHPLIWLVVMFPTLSRYVSVTRFMEIKSFCLW